MRQLTEKTGGTAGRLIAELPKAARARTDPFDGGRFERWQDPRFTFRVLNNIDAFGASGIYERLFINARAPTS
jgi:hypothetical protein